MMAKDTAKNEAFEGAKAANPKKIDVTLSQIINEVHKHIPFFQKHADRFCSMVELFAKHFIECANNEKLQYNKDEREKRDKAAEKLNKEYREALNETIDKAKKEKEKKKKTEKKLELELEKESGMLYQNWKVKMQELNSELPAPEKGCRLYEKAYGDEDEYGFMDIPFDLSLQKFWITPGPVNCIPWLLVTHQRLKEKYSASMSDKERLMCKCIILSVAHDEGGNWSSSDERIYRHKTYKGYFKRNEFCQELWRQLEGDEGRIQRAFEQVEGHLPKDSNANEIQPQENGGGDITEYTFKKTGDFWTVSFGGETAYIANDAGIPYVYFLLSRSGETFTTGKFLSEYNEKTIVLTGGDKTLDAEAKRNYKERIKDINIELENAKSNNDFAAQERLEDEKTKINTELLNTAGFAGHGKKLNTEYGTYRLSIGNAIKRAIKNIDKHLPELATHLRESILKPYSSTSLSYRPLKPIDWML